MVYGPAMPSLDATLSPRLFEVPRSGSLVRIYHDGDADRSVAELLFSLPPSDAITISPAPLEVSVHESEHGPRVLFVINPTHGLLDATLTIGGGMRLEDVLTGETFEGDGTIALPAPAQTCRFFRVDHVRDRRARVMESAG